MRSVVRVHLSPLAEKAKKIANTVEYGRNGQNVCILSEKEQQRSVSEPDACVGGAGAEFANRAPANLRFVGKRSNREA